MTMASRKVLIVEDEALVGMMLAKKIEITGFCVCEVVSTGEEAVSAAELHSPGVILMDVSLGGQMDGIEAGSEIQKKLDIPIVFFTGYHQDKHLLKRAERIKPLAVLDKLGTFDEVVAVLRKAFDVKRT